MPTAFSSVSPSGAESISLISQTTSPVLASEPQATLATPAAQQPRLEPTSHPVMHRVAEVREQQGLSLRTVARRTGVDLKVLRRQEDPSTDMTLSDLLLWQKALEVPLVDLLEDESQALSRPVKERAKMVRIMKTVVSLGEVCQGNPRLGRLTTMLREQLLELMPELSEIGGWPQCGSRRGADVMGRIFHEPIAVEFDSGD
jgi:transcriptional regulator with XRE-family HTH domain